MLSQSRFNAIHSGLTSIAKKVYEAVPMQDAWDAAQVVNELKRQGIVREYRLVAGCLDSLKRSGVVMEPTPGKFQREPIREVVSKPKPSEEEVKPTTTTTTAKAVEVQNAQPLDRLGALSQRTVQIMAMVKELAADIGDAAVEIQQQLDAKDEDLKKLHQLRELLKTV